MPGVNSIFQQPLAIHKAYALDIIGTMLASDKVYSGTQGWSEQAYTASITAQINAISDTGANSFPVLLDIKGPIIKYSSWNFIGTQFYAKLLQQLETDSRVSGVVLDIDSGGGMIAGTGELASTIRDFKKPVVAYTGGLMASAAYWIGSAADLIVANEHADVIGSIGSFMSYEDISGILEKHGAKRYEVYAPQSDLKNKAWRDMLTGDEQAMQKNLQQHTDKFINTIKEHRADQLQDDGEVFRGQVYTAQQAKEIGLVDHVQTLEWVMNQF
ncbi:MAG: S49 family peptidase [Weeksellaceae bacterium]|nr:S49 family peptidase [Weeksellaceae bacterium]